MKGRERVVTITTLGVDLGKNSCSLAGLDATGAVVLRRRLSRGKLVEFLGRLPPCVVGMEACCGAHHLGRAFGAQGHEVRLMSPEYVQRDAEAIAEAATRPTMRFVALKSEVQLDQQTLHRARSRLVNGRTRLINQLRAILLERGITVAKGRHVLGRALGALLGDEGSGLSPRMKMLLDEMRREWAELDARIAALDREFVETARVSAPARRLATIPGIGALNATALTAAVGEAEDFATGRDPGSGWCRGR